MMAGTIRVVRVVLLPCTAALFVAWWLAGDRSERDGYATIIEFPFLEHHAGWFGFIGLMVAVVVATDVSRAGVMRRRFALITVAAAVVGGAAGCAARVITAKTAGANIGGGLLLFVMPPVMAATLAVLAYRAFLPERR